MIRISEPVAATGGLAGQGFTNLLGRPECDALTLVLRESGQNVWDARNRNAVDGSPPRMLVRIRTLTDSQAQCLRGIVLSGGDDDEPRASNSLFRLLEERNKPIRVLEICDFGTVGLEGVTDPRHSPSHFTKFFFSYGDAHPDGRDGGTYGYGRSSLYLAGMARTIFVDSLTTDENGRTDRRFMGSRIGDKYGRVIDGVPRQFTGRHFWGNRQADGAVSPVTGAEAAELAASLGLPTRRGQEKGTSILIPWPDTPDDGDGRVSGNRVAQILLHNFWPKMVSRGSVIPMEFNVEEDGREIAVPDPQSHPAYKLFKMALNYARNPNLGVAKAITVGIDRKVTGHIAFYQSINKRGNEPAGASDDAVPERMFNTCVNHVALMRASELVVTYLPFPGICDDHDWAGVFLCSAADDVSAAFAKSENPTHDDWVAERLQGREKTWVKMTKTTRIPSAVRENFGVIQDPMPGPNQEHGTITPVLDQFSETYLSGDGDAPAPNPGGGVGGGKGGEPRLPKPVFSGLRYDSASGHAIATFKVNVTAQKGIEVRADVEVVGAGLDELPDDMRPPEIIAWSLPDGRKIEGDVCRLADGGEYGFEVRFNGRYAVKTKCYLVGKI